MLENIMKFFKKFNKKQENVPSNSRETAKERLHLVLMQDRANVSADFLELMKQEIIEVIKKYIDVDEKAIDVRLTNKENEDGTNGAPALYANIPILNIKNEARKMEKKIHEEKQEKNQKIENENVKQQNENKEKIEKEIEEQDIKINNQDLEEKSQKNSSTSTKKETKIETEEETQSNKKEDKEEIEKQEKKSKKQSKEDKKEN